MPEGSLLETTYEFLSKVTEGGMGAIYKVRHRHLGEIRIVKVLKPELLGNSEMVQRFAYEAQIVTRLKHPNIAAIYDFVVEDDGMAYIVMEYVDGSNLAQLLNRVSTVELPLALEIASQVLDALSYLHKKKIVHRDVSANNIMLTVGEEDELQVKLIDMGLAKSLETVKAMTSTGVIMGNLFYASPEQLGNNIDGDPLDGRSDLYSLGAVLYEMTTGVRAFNGKTPMDLVSAHAFKAPMSFEESDPDGRVPDPLRNVILRALEKSAGKRFSSAEAFKDALRPIRASLDAPVDLSVLAEAIRSSRPKSSAANPSLAGWNSTPGRRGSTPGRVRTPLPKPGSGVVFPDTATSDAPPEDDSPEGRRPIRPGSTDKTRLVDVKSAASLSDVTTPPSRNLLLLVVALGGALAATGGLFLYRTFSEPPRAAPIRRAPANGATGPLPTVEPAPTAAPAATPVPTTVIAPPRPDEAASAQRVKADLTRDYAVKARQRAERAGGAELASFGAGTKSFREGETRLAASRFVEAAAAFQKAVESYGESESAAADAARQKLLEKASAASATAVPVPTRPPAPRPTDVPAKPREEEKPRPPAVAVPSAEEKIRATLARYAAAQSSLDVDAYLALYPSLARDRSRIEDAFRNLRSQVLEVEVRKIDVEGDHATAKAQETRSYVPKIGSEGHATRAVTIRLQQKGADWIITKIE